MLPCTNMRRLLSPKSVCDEVKQLPGDGVLASDV